jgi:hypothetical protein
MESFTTNVLKDKWKCEFFIDKWRLNPLHRVSNKKKLTGRPKAFKVAKGQPRFDELEACIGGIFLLHIVLHPDTAVKTRRLKEWCFFPKTARVKELSAA